MNKNKLESYQKPLLELIEIESADICIAGSPKIAPETTPFEPVAW